MATTIDPDDVATFAYGQGRPNQLSRDRVDEVELPVRVEVSYLNPLTDYATGLQQAQRLITNSRGVMAVDLPMALTNDEAAQVADILLTNVWTERVTYEFTLPFKYVYLDPGDEVSITLNGATHSIRITEMTYQAPVLITFRGITADAAVYTSQAEGGAEEVQGQSIPTLGGSRIEFVDCAPLRDVDNEAGYYIGGSGYLPSWPGAVLYKSNNEGESYYPIDSLTNESAIGVVLSAPTSTTITGAWDYGTTFRIRLLSGSLSNATASAIESTNDNLAIVGNEIINFQTASAYTSGYEIRGLLRGRYNTEYYAYASHAVDERFMVLNRAVMHRIDEANTSEIDVERYFKFVTQGRLLADTPTELFTNTGQSITPWAPCNPTVYRASGPGDDITIGWTPRARYGGAWRDGVNATADPELAGYQLDIIKSNGSVTRSALVSSGATSYTYTSANQKTDFASTVDSGLQFKLYPYSSTINLGNGISVNENTLPDYDYVYATTFTAT